MVTKDGMVNFWIKSESKVIEPVKIIEPVKCKCENIEVLGTHPTYYITQCESCRVVKKVVVAAEGKSKINWSTVWTTMMIIGGIMWLTGWLIGQ